MSVVSTDTTVGDNGTCPLRGSCSVALIEATVVIGVLELGGAVDAEEASGI